MKRTKKFLVGFLASLSVFCGSLGLVACGDTESSSGAGEATQIEKVYAQYVVYAQAEGQTPLSYEEWLSTIKGEKGDKGDKGDTGAQGEKGEKGDTGAQGEKGDTGATGEQGPQGDKGDTGAQGEKGEKGDTGADGVGIENAYINEDGELIIQLTVGEPINLGKVVGKDGEQGIQGEKGEQGEQGIQGEKGEQGEQGIQGEKGEQGEQGIQGEKGEQGEQGIQGEKGDAGATGVDGVGIKNAYINADGELIVELTVGEPINLGKVVGKDGEQGIQGEKGEQGEQGIQGEKGEQGEQGIQGEKGEQGEQGEKGDKGDKGDTGAQGVGIEKVEYDENGDLKITFTDGTTQTIVMPDKHVHTFGEWTNFTTENVNCENRLLYRVCSSCNSIEWRQGTDEDHKWNVETTAPTCTEKGYDTKTCSVCGKVEVDNCVDEIGHDWAEEYSCDNSYHWLECGRCNEMKDKQEHEDGDTAYCPVCGEKLASTEGILYESCGTYAQVIGYEGRSTKVRIAEMYNGLPVKSIYTEAFYLNREIVSVIIPEGVTVIWNRAFTGCRSLTNIIIPDSVTSIGDEAFWDCRSLTSISIPNSVTSIGGDVFLDCSSLQFNEYGNCKYLGNTSNSYLALVSVASTTNISYTIHEKTKIIVERAFKECRSLTSIIIPDNVITIGDETFYHCSALTSVMIGDGVTSIGNSAFAECGGLTEVRIGNSVISIGAAAFGNCGSLTSIIIPNGVTSIANGTFSDCRSLTSIEIPDSVTTIGNYAFANTTSLKSITIPANVMEMKAYAFVGSGLQQAILENPTEWQTSLSFSYTYEKIHDSTDIRTYEHFYDISIPENAAKAMVGTVQLVVSSEYTIYLGNIGWKDTLGDFNWYAYDWTRVIQES